MKKTNNKYTRVPLGTLFFTINTIIKLNMKDKKNIVLIGAGAVGTSFLYSAINQKLAHKYGIIDLNTEVAIGNKLDLEDAIATLDYKADIETGGYELVKDADILVITAGRPQKEGESRLDMVKDNTLIIKSIAKQVKENGFNGITIMVSNPVDICATVYQRETGFDASKVISSSCALDTSRLKIDLSHRLNIHHKLFNIYVLGEHGDSSVPTYTFASVDGKPLMNIFEEQNISKDDIDEITNSVHNKAYEIINKKKATFYGIGAKIAEICDVIINNRTKVMAVGTLLKGEYGQEGVYAAVPCQLDGSGFVKTIEFPLSEEELKKFTKSIEVLKETFNKTLEL
ncbi:MAG: L-lactate dehydrogenase [Pikeienuella sp.]